MQSISTTTQPSSIQLEMENLNPNNQEENGSMHSNRFNRCLRTIDSGLGACKQWIIKNPVPASLIGLGLLTSSFIGFGVGLAVGLKSREITPTPTPTPKMTPNETTQKLEEKERFINFFSQHDTPQEVFINSAECKVEEKKSEQCTSKCIIKTKANCIEIKKGNFRSIKCFNDNEAFLQTYRFTRPEEYMASFEIIRDGKNKPGWENQKVIHI